jgi:recombination protein RecA
VVSQTTLNDILDQAYADEDLTFESVIADKGYIPTGNLGLDYVLGGGVARGRITELYGLSQSGKTTTACQVAAQCQKMGLPVLYLDFEQALDKPYMNQLGVDTENRGLFHPYPAASLEQGMHVASKVARTGKIGCIIFDSVPAMTLQKILEEDGESRTSAMERARILSNELGKLNPILARTGTAAVFINHERDVIEMTPARPGMPKRTTTPGGSALKYYASQRVQFKIIKTFKGERIDPLSGEKINETHSVLVQATVTKNKLTRPMQVAQLYLVLGEGFSDGYSAMKVLEANKVVKKAGAFYYFPEDLYHPQMKSGDKGASMQGLVSILALSDFDSEWGIKLSDRARDILSMPISLVPKLVDDPETGGTVSDPDPDPEVVEEIHEPEVVIPAAPVVEVAPEPAPTPASVVTAKTETRVRAGGPDLSHARRLV